MLQELVYEARNPSISSQNQLDNSTNGADASATGDESDSGEGRLGGPNGSTFPGSSSAAGAGVGSLRNRGMGGEGGLAGAQQGAPASSTLRARRTNRHLLDDDDEEEEERVVYGPRQFGNRGAEWSFTGLGDDDSSPSHGLAGGGRLMTDVDSDADSTTATMDDAPALHSQDHDHDSFSNFSSRNRPTPTSSSDTELPDYSPEPMYLPDAGSVGGQGGGFLDDEEGSPPVVNVYPDLPPSEYMPAEEEEESEQT